MRPVLAGALVANRPDEHTASRARVEFRAQLKHHREVERRAREVLNDAIVAAGVTTHAGTSILAAADSPRKTAVIAALAERIDPQPVEGGGE